MIQYYQNTYSHIKDELILIDLILHYEILKKRHEKYDINNFSEKNGIFITENKLNSLLSDDTVNDWFVRSNSLNDGMVKYSPFTNIIHTFKSKIEARIKASLQNGIELRLIKLAEFFNLSEIDIKILLLCLAPRFNPEFEKSFIYLQSSKEKGNPTIDFIVNLLSASSEQRLIIERYFLPESSLIKYGLIEFIETSTKQEIPYWSKQLKINDRLYFYLLGKDVIDRRFSTVSELFCTDTFISNHILPDDLKQELIKFTESYKNSSHKNILLSFHGPYGSGKKEAAAAITREMNLPLLVIDLSAALESGYTLPELLDTAYRESLLIPAVPYFINSDIIFSENNDLKRNKKYLNLFIDRLKGLSFVNGDKPIEYQGEMPNNQLREFVFTMPSYSLRKNIWEKYFSDLNKEYMSDEIDILADRFQLTEGQIQDAIEAGFRIAKDGTLTLKDLFHGCRSQSNHGLKVLARKIESKYTLDDFIVSDKKKMELQHIIDLYNERHTIYEVYGLGDKSPRGKGVTASFSGYPGTGKTMAAEIIANELELDLYKIDLSKIVSKYIGETEKNLSRVFQEAEMSNAILFFDEADALFGKRTEIKDAHDRYANIEISYLLQKMEEYDGITILATNYGKNIDEAFNRRLKFKILFYFPDLEERKIIWKKVFPEKTPLSDDIDYDLIAKIVDMSGGDIKLIALIAAMFAAKEKSPITMKHIMLSIYKHFKRSSKSFNDDDFKEYGNYIE